MAVRVPRFDIRQASKRILVVLAILVVLSGAYHLFVVRPVIREYKALNALHQLSDDALEERESQVEHRESFLAGLEQAKKDLQQLREEVLSTREERLVEVQAELARLAREFNIDLTTVDYDTETLLDEELDRFVMVVPLEGGYANLRKFLQAVEDSDKFLVVERVALARGKRGGKLLSLNINVATYFNPPPELIERMLSRRRPRRS